MVAEFARLGGVVSGYSVFDRGARQLKGLGHLCGRSSP